MRGRFVLLVVVFLAATVFALSNTSVVTVMFWQWPIYTGSLALAIVGTGVLGALLAFLTSLARHAHLRGRVHDLERRLAAHQPAPSAAPDTPPAGTPPGTHTAPSDLGQTRRLW
ncbi:MAG TPA: LapA family protein [bacterium]|nr:LapA family protein [bacterium]